MEHVLLLWGIVFVLLLEIFQWNTESNCKSKSIDNQWLIGGKYKVAQNEKWKKLVVGFSFYILNLNLAETSYFWKISSPSPCQKLHYLCDTNCVITEIHYHVFSIL